MHKTGQCLRSHGEWNGEKLGRHASRLGLHLWTGKAEHQPSRMQNSSDRTTDEPDEKSREDD